MSMRCPQGGAASGKDHTKESTSWARLRVAGLCIRVDEYLHIGNLNNAVRDAEAVCKRLQATPNCYAAQIVDSGVTSKAVTSTAVDLLRSVRRRLQEPGLLQDPPALFILHYAGHGIQTKGGQVYLVPHQEITLVYICRIRMRLYVIKSLNDIYMSNNF